MPTPAPKRKKKAKAHRSAARPSSPKPAAKYAPKRAAKATPATPRDTTPATGTPTDAPEASTAHARAHESDKPAPVTDAEAIDLYMEELALCGQYTRAAAKSGRSAKFFQRRRRADARFREMEQDALSTAPDAVRSEITRRAMEGTMRFTKYGAYVEYDNGLLLRLAEFLETGQWRQRQQVETGAPGAFKTAADLDEAIANREKKLAEARAEMEADAARDRGEMPVYGGESATPETSPKAEG